MDRSSYIEWLRSNTNNSSYTIRRYAGAIETIFSDLNDYGMDETDIYESADLSVIDVILKNPQFIAKNTKGNRMYSAALNHLKSFIKETKYQEFIDELNKAERNYEKNVRKTPPSKNKREITDKVEKKPKYREINRQKLWHRNPLYASEAILHAGYFCEIDKNHQHFTSKFNKQNYVEAHHLIPMKFQEQFDCSLDVHANIVSLCLVCHKKLHFSNFVEKKEVLKKLFSERIARLKKAGVSISVDDLYSYYQD